MERDGLGDLEKVGSDGIYVIGTKVPGNQCRSLRKSRTLTGSGSGQ